MSPPPAILHFPLVAASPLLGATVTLIFLLNGTTPMPFSLPGLKDNASYGVVGNRPLPYRSEVPFETQLELPDPQLSYRFRQHPALSYANPPPRRWKALILLV